MDVVEATVPAARMSLDDSANREKSVLPSEDEERSKRRVRLKELIAVNSKGVRVVVKVRLGNPFKETIQQVMRSRYDLVMLAPEVKGRSN